MKEYEEIGMTDMQFANTLRQDKFLNDLIIEAIESGENEKALRYLKQDNERIIKIIGKQQ